MSSKGKKILIAACAAAVVVIAVIIAVVVLRKEESYRVIKVYEVSGDVTVKRDGKGDMEPYENMLLESGDTVVVNSGSMTLKLDEDKYVYVEEETEFSVEATGTSENSKTTIVLKKGAITNEIQNKLSDDSSYEVNTPNSTMAVRGTVFRVEISYDDKGTCYTKVSVLEGKVSSNLVYADGTVSDKSVDVEKGYEVIIYQDGSKTDYLTEVQPIDYSKLPASVQKRFEKLLEDVKKDEENNDSGRDEYVVTFMYNDSVFGTQTVKAGECAEKPSLMPAPEGDWDYDFENPVDDDIVIDWKE